MTLLAERLRAAADELASEERVSLQQLADAHGGAALGSWLVLLSLPCILPIAGLGSVLGCGLLALCTAVLRDQQQPSLPGAVAGLALPRRSAHKLLHRLADFYAFSARWTRQRAPGLLQARAWLAAKLGFMAVLIILPMPLGNVLPALAVALLGLGLVFRDGLAVLASAAMAVLATAYAGALGVGLLWLGREGLARWLS